MDQLALNELRSRHPVGLTGIWATYPRKQFRKGLKYPIAVTATYVAICYISNTDTFKLIQDFVSVTFTVVPCLLGFLLGGYTILIGFSNPELLRATTRTTDKNPVSLFQTMSSVFAVCIAVQVFCLFTAGIMHLTSALAIHWVIAVKFISHVVKLLNYIGLALLLFALSYAIICLIAVLVNVFNFAQVYHFRLSQQRINEEAALHNEPEHEY